MRDIDGMLCVGAPNSPARAKSALRCCEDCAERHNIESVESEINGQCYVCENDYVALRVVGKLFPVSEIKSLELTLRSLDEYMIARMKESIAEDGQRLAILLNADNVCVDGYLRLAGTVALGRDKIIVKHAEAYC